MPTSLFDPKWKEPAIAARVAYTIYCRIPRDMFTSSPSSPPPSVEIAHTDARSFALVHRIEAENGDFKGGWSGELHRRSAVGPHTVNFPAQAVAFGVDAAGRFFLSAVVGRFDGPW